MTTVQNVGMNNQPRQQKRSVIVPTAVGMLAGGALGAASGAYIKDMPLVPPKYLTLQSFVEGMQKGDKLEISERMPKEAKLEFLGLQQFLHEPSDKLDAQLQLLGDKKVLSVEEFLKEYANIQVPQSTTAEKYLNLQTDKLQLYNVLSERINNATKDEIVKSSDLIEILNKSGIKEPENKLLGIVFGNNEKSPVKQLPEKIKITAGLKRKFKAKNNRYNNCQYWLQYTNALFDNGKITAESIAENTKKELAEKMKNKEAQAAFEKVKGFLNKSKAKGAIIWGAIGAAVVGAITLILEAAKTPKTTSYPGIEAKYKQSLNTHQG